MVAGSKFRGEFEDRLKAVIKEIEAQEGKTIHTLVGAGAAEGAIDASNILKEPLSRGKFQLIGATTLDEYREHIEKDSAFERRFQKVYVREPTIEETIEILAGLRKTLQDHHKVEITDGAIEAAARLSERYISDRFLPDKAIDLIDEAASRIRVDGSGDKVTEAEIASLVSQWTGIPVERMLEEEKSRLAKMEDALHERIIDQEEGVRAIGVGKTELAKALAGFLFGSDNALLRIDMSEYMERHAVARLIGKALAGFLFGSDSALLRIDMSEYMERHAVARLIGSPPGYIGYEEGGQLTEAVRRRPYQVILFDEIEKAHPQVMNLEGRLTDGHGRTVDFRHTILILTSNVGSEEFQSEASEETIQRKIRELRKTFRPEFLNRIDEIIIFHPLSEEAIEKIVELKVAGLNERLAEQGITLSLTDEAKRILAKEGYDPHYGARPLARALKRLIENPLASKIVSGEINEGDAVIVDAAAMSDALVIRKKNGKES